MFNLWKNRLKSGPTAGAGGISPVVEPVFLLFFHLKQLIITAETLTVWFKNTQNGDRQPIYTHERGAIADINNTCTLLPPGRASRSCLASCASTRCATRSTCWPCWRRRWTRTSRSRCASTCPAMWRSTSCRRSTRVSGNVQWYFRSV